MSGQREASGWTVGSSSSDGVNPLPYLTRVHTEVMAPLPTVLRSRRVCIAILGVAVGGGLSACSHGSAAPPARIVVSAAPSLLSDPVGVTIDGLPARSAVTVQASARDSFGQRWTSSARYSASASGRVSLGQPSVGGSYTGVNAMGLFEFMAPPATDTSATYFSSSRAGFTVSLTAVADGKTVARASIDRQGSAAVGVTEKSYRPSAGGLYADMLLPAANGARTGLRPAVLAFGGSEGGLNSSLTTAGELAAHGYPTLDLAYFAEPGLPSRLENVPLEYFAKALTLLRSQPGVDPHHVLVMGVSRGGEAALLLGATYPSLIDGVIAGVPSAYVQTGYPDFTNPAWTLGGQPVPALSAQQGLSVDGGNPVAVNDPSAEIAVERIRGPILLTCGGDDQVWPSCSFTAQITARLKVHHFAYPVTSLRYPNAGHYGGDFGSYFPITIEYLTSPTLGYTGGTVNATEPANAANFQHLLALLRAQR
jgi:pimeloyl-ACP methyl ester carboxylesterase